MKNLTEHAFDLCMYVTQKTSEKKEEKREKIKSCRGQKCCVIWCKDKSLCNKQSAPNKIELAFEMVEMSLNRKKK